MTQAHTRETTSGETNVFSRFGRRIAAGILTVGALAAVVGTVLVIATFAFAVAVIVTIAVVCMWGIARVMGPRRKRAEGEDGVLEARRGPHGWTVDVAGTRVSS